MSDIGKFHPMKTLFPENFLAALSRLSLASRKVPPRAAVGSYLSRAAGASLEFRDYNSYAPGDDLRRVDWAVYGRTRHLFVRRFERPTQMPVYLLVDASVSMFLETPSRYATAARVTAAVTSAALSSQNPVHVLVADGRPAAASRALTGRRGFVRALAEMSADREPGRTSISQSIAAVRPLLAAKGPGVLVVVSDFFDDRGADAVIDALRQVPGRLALLHITQPWDAEPAVDADLELADCETGTRLVVSPTADLIARYRQAYRAYFDTLQHYANARGGAITSFDAASDTLPQLQRLFPAGVMAI